MPPLEQREAVGGASWNCEGLENTSLGSPLDQIDSENLIQIMLDPIMLWEEKTGVVLTWNSAARALLGYDDHEVVGASITKVVGEEQVHLLEAGHAAHIKGIDGAAVVDSRPIKILACCKDGQELLVEATLTPITCPDRSNRYVLAVLRDASHHQRLEREHAGMLAVAREHTRRLGELASLKAGFSAMVAHELAAPVAAIRALADLLASGRLPPDSFSALHAAIQAEANLLATLVDDLREAAVAERSDFSVNLRPYPAAALVADTVAFAQTLPGNHPCTSHVGTGASVLADPDRIGQVLRNLVGNAARHTPPGTPISIRATPVGRSVRFEVADEGPGIHPDDLNRIFEKFGRGRATDGGRVHGAGLGLYISRRIVAAHGGSLTVTTAPGAGATFAFSLEAAP